MPDSLLRFFQFMAQWGVWDIIGLLVVIVPTVFVLRYLFPPKWFRNLYIDTKIESNPDAQFTKVIAIELRNHASEPVYVLSRGFIFDWSVRPFPGGARNAATGIHEVKFEGKVAGVLSEIDALIRPNEIAHTWIPLDPAQSDDSIADALENRRLGTLRLKAQRIAARPYRFVDMDIPV